MRVVVDQVSQPRVEGLLTDAEDEKDEEKDEDDGDEPVLASAGRCHGGRRVERRGTGDWC